MFWFFSQILFRLEKLLQVPRGNLHLAGLGLLLVIHTLTSEGNSRFLYCINFEQIDFCLGCVLGPIFSELNFGKNKRKSIIQKRSSEKVIYQLEIFEPLSKIVVLLLASATPNLLLISWMFEQLQILRFYNLEEIQNCWIIMIESRKKQVIFNAQRPRVGIYNSIRVQA